MKVGFDVKYLLIIGINDFFSNKEVMLCDLHRPFHFMKKLRLHNVSIL